MMHDVYFLPAYGKLNEKIEGGRVQTFDFRCAFGQIRSVYIKREIPFVLDGVQYFDAVTPYGYGGPVVLEASDREKLLACYSEAYREKCREERIVDEFVRFHPLAENALDFRDLYEVSFNRHTIAVDLTEDTYLYSQFTPDCRNMIRKAAKKGVVTQVDENCEHLEEFIQLYYATMEKNFASSYYYFEKSYFEGLKNSEAFRLILINAYVENEIIASSMFMRSDENMHYHLSATNPEYYSFASNNAILALACEYGHEQRLKNLHLGGGLSADEKDPLLRFKRNFGRQDKNLKDFYLGKAIFLPEVYEKLCSLTREAGQENEQDLGNFFPAYRKAH